METQVSSSIRKLSLREQDDGLASISNTNNNNIRSINHGYPFVYNNNNNYYYNGGIMMRRRNSLRNIACLTSSTLSVYSPRSSNRVLNEAFQSPHFLQACALCHKPLGCNRDIFMYRGNTPYCSEECRQEQIDKDEAEEKNRNYKKALRSKKDAKNSSSPSKSPNYPFYTGTVAAA